MSPKARELKKLNDLEQLAHTDWREERDNDTEEVPKPGRLSSKPVASRCMIFRHACSGCAVRLLSGQGGILLRPGPNKPLPALRQCVR